MFKLSFNIPSSTKKANLKDPILLVGSCFSDEIGERLRADKFNALSNPFGTIYNPHSIFRLLTNQVSPENTIENEGVFYHWDTHSSISALNEQEVTGLFQERHQETQQFLKSTQWLIITLGTAWVYEYKNAGIVGNCHKVPQTKFSKRLLSQSEIKKQFDQLYSHLKIINPGINILFTVSPVRHIRDGLVENNRSKAILLDAIHSIVDQYESVNYFPSFEIIMDELRDYRFFKEDMIHPSEQAVNYVWDRFGEAYFDIETQSFMTEWGKLRQTLNHQPLKPESIKHQKFIKSTIKKLERLNEKANLSVEIQQISQKLKK